MSERSSFVTEFIYCDKCFEAAKKVLLSDNKYLCSTTIPAWKGLERPELPIIAGKIGGLFDGDSYDTLQSQLIPKLEDSICHKIRLAVLFDNGDNEIVEVYPKK